MKYYKFIYFVYFYVLILWLTNYSLDSTNLQNKGPTTISFQTNTILFIVSDKNILSNREQSVFKLSNKFELNKIFENIALKSI